MRSITFTQIALVALSTIHSTHAHTWIELLTNLASDGSFTGQPGYPRNYHNRSDPGWNDGLQTYMIEAQTPINNPNMCPPSAQDTSDASQRDYPRLSTSPGTPISVLYQENGHVTKFFVDLGKPANRGTVYIYGTQDPKVGEKYYDVYQQWNQNGTGGDGRGKLLTVQNFDDGQCYQNNQYNTSLARQKEYPITNQTALMGDNLWCQNNFIIPTNVDTSKLLTLYWVWKWDTQAGVDPNLPHGKNQTYTSCMDLELKPVSSSRVVKNYRYAASQIQEGGVGNLFNQLANGNPYVTGDASVSSGPLPTGAPSGATTLNAGPQASTAGSTCASQAATTQTVYVFGSSTGTIAPSGTGLSSSTLVPASSSATPTSPPTMAPSSEQLTTFTSSSASSSQVPDVVSQISDGQPQATGVGAPPIISQTAAASVATSSSSVVATPAATSVVTSASSAPSAAATSTIGSDPSVEPVPTNPTATFSAVPTSASSSSSTVAATGAGVSASASAATSVVTAVSTSTMLSATATPTIPASSTSGNLTSRACNAAGKKRKSKIFGSVVLPIDGGNTNAGAQTKRGEEQSQDRVHARQFPWRR